MPAYIDWPLRRPPRRRRLFLLVALIALVVFGGRTALSYFVDWLWFQSLGFAAVFTKTLALQWIIFAVFAAATFFALYGAFLLLRRGHLLDLPTSHTIFFGGQPLRLSVEPALRLIALVGSVIIALVTAVGMMAEWQTLSLFWYAPAGVAKLADPIFGQP